MRLISDTSVEQRRQRQACTVRTPIQGRAATIRFSSLRVSVPRHIAVTRGCARYRRAAIVLWYSSAATVGTSEGLRRDREGVHRSTLAGAEVISVVVRHSRRLLAAQFQYSDEFVREGLQFLAT
jgi:hypothetical protein